ncbi:MAG: conjugal transfer protein [Humibacillus sp.]|nr:conjugal transfer protein [Humibacillus sp.]MDN5777152.1 conjugal transfer protein [Humibacillus sp.]
MLTLRRRDAQAPTAHRPGRLGLGGNLAAVASTNRPDHPSSGLEPQDGGAPQEQPDAVGSHDAESTGHRWSAGSGLLTKATTGLLSLALLTGPAALVLHLTSAPTVTASASAAGQDAKRDSRRGVAQELAGQLVRAWLSSSTATPLVGAYWKEPVDLPAAGSRVGSLSVVDATATAPGVWSVTIGADVTGPTPKAPTVRRFFLVPVAVDGGTGDAASRALALPAETAAPAVAADRGLQYGIAVPGTAAAGTTVSAYLAALLTGTGDITRYLTPGVSVTAITPPPYAQARVERIEANDEVDGLLTGTPANGATVHVRVTTSNFTAPPATAKSGDTGATKPAEDMGLTGQFLLQLTARDGRWEVSGVDQAPQMSPPVEPPAPAS